MRRVSRRSCEDGPLLEDQETEGQRQLHSLLLQQLHTNVNFDRCVAKRKSFAPAAVYRPFGEQAAGVRSLSQFQALQDGEKELANLREQGLTDAEIQLWQSRDAPESTEMSHGVCAAPAAKQQRLQAIRDKIEARDKLLSMPQRFAASRPLSRREMEIEQSLFQGNERLGFLAALYHRDENEQKCQQGEPSSVSMDSIYNDLLMRGRREPSQLNAQGESVASSNVSPCRTSDDLSHDSLQEVHQSDDTSGHKFELYDAKGSSSGAAKSNISEPQTDQNKEENSPPPAPAQIKISQPIGRLCGAVKAGAGGPVTITGEIQPITDEEILKDRESEEGIQRIPRFRNYQPGNPSKVLCLKNLSAHASVAQLVALFSRFEQEGGPPVLYRLLTGRMKGQAFITLSDAETAQRALQLLHGYRGLGKPLVVEFGRERQEGEQPGKEVQRERKF